MQPPTALEMTIVMRRLDEQAGGAETFTALCRALGVGSDELAQIARRRALVDAFLRANLEGSGTVSDAEIERVYAEGEHPFKEMTLDAAREAFQMAGDRAAGAIKVVLEP